MCRLSFTPFTVRKHANLKSQIPAFASAGNSRKVLLCQLKVSSSEEVHSIRGVTNFVELSQFNVR